MNARKATRWALGLALALGVWVQEAKASNPAFLDLKVTFTGNVSVAVDGMQYSTRTFNADTNQLFVPSSATVTNDSSGITEKWQLSVSSVAGGGDWAVQGTTDSAPGTDQYALQAVFISSAVTANCPSSLDARWNLPSIVTAAAQTYQTTRYADATSQGAGGTGNPDGTSGGQDGNMFSVTGNGRGRRGFCVRLYMPFASTTVTEQTLRVTVTAVAGG